MKIFFYTVERDSFRRPLEEYDWPIYERGAVMQTDTHSDNRSYRLLDLYKRLQQGEALTKRELADKYRVSEKTVQRDIEGVHEYGYS